MGQGHKGTEGSLIRLTRADVVRLKNSSEVAQKVENKWVDRIRREIATESARSFDSISIGGEIYSPNFEKIFIQHYFDTQIAALKLAEIERELESRTKRLAVKPKTLKQVMELYDRWRKGLFKPKSIQRKADSIKRAYISAIQSAWRAHSEAFRNGDVATQAEVRKIVVESTGMTSARAQTTVRTETTRYYTDARKSYYDQSPDITHYLFLAVRDKGTTVWCTSSTINGLRGRSGLIYAKDDPLLKKEKPPCHWCCRSELLPLSMKNPVHRKMIENLSMARRSHKCHPLPPEWNK